MDYLEVLFSFQVFGGLDVMDEQGECGVIGMMMAFGNDRSGLGVSCRLRQPTRATAPQRPPPHSRLHSEASDCWQWVKHC